MKQPWHVKPLAAVAIVEAGDPAPLGRLLRQRFDYSRVLHPEAERFVTVRLYGKGAVQRSVGDGKVPKMSSALRIRAGDLIYSRIDARNGAFAIVPQDLEGAVVSKDFPSFAIDRTRVHPQYLNYFLGTEAFFSQLRASSFGTTNRQRISESKLLSHTIPLPPLPEQERIVRILDAAEELRRVRAEADRRTADIIPAIFYEMFGDPVRNSMLWPMIRLGEACDLINGRAFKPNEWGTEGLPIIRIQNLNDASKPFNFYSGELPEKFRVNAGDILLSWSGTPGTSFGCFRWQGPEGWLNQHIFNVKLRRGIDGEFFIQSVNARLAELIGKAHGGVGLQHVTKGMLNSTVLLLPPLPLQRQFAARVTEVRALEDQQAASRRRLDDLFASLLHRAFQSEL
ncbi:MAG TPA: restriction endonuclease subunit S [Terriglobia bacterium]|nr:restriction endonuclease subunit S [Terriglobia bacterium]